MSARIPTFVGVAVLFLFPFSVYARSMSISVDKTSLFGDEELMITTTHSDFTEGESIYIKGAFYQENPTKNYFGYTKKDGSWIKNGEDTVTQRQVVIGNWDNTITVKSDFSDSGYKGEGEYKLLVGYYYTTSTGTLSSVKWSSDSATIMLNDPDPTPTNTPTSTPVPTSTPMPTSSPTLTPTNTSTSTPTNKPTSIPTMSPTPRLTDDQPLAETPQPSPTGIVLGVQDDEAPNNKPYVIALLFISVGCALLAAVFVIKNRIQSKR